MNKAIYEHDTVESFLDYTWREKKLVNPHLSIRAWARAMDIKHHSSLFSMVRGDRKIPKYLIPKITKNLNLSLPEALYLDILIDLSRAKSDAEKAFHLHRKDILRKTAVSFDGDLSDARLVHKT